MKHKEELSDGSRWRTGPGSLLRHTWRNAVVIQLQPPTSLDTTRQNNRTNTAFEHWYWEKEETKYRESKGEEKVKKNPHIMSWESLLMGVSTGSFIEPTSQIGYKKQLHAAALPTVYVWHHLRKIMKMKIIIIILKICHISASNHFNFTSLKFVSLFKFTLVAVWKSKKGVVSIAVHYMNKVPDPCQTHLHALRHDEWWKSRKTNRTCWVLHILTGQFKLKLDNPVKGGT